MKGSNVCTVMTCDKERYHSALYCQSHGRAAKLYGNPLVRKGSRWGGLTVRERWWKYVSKGSGDECWFWVGSRDGKGYGRLNVNNYPELAHRLAWTLLCGDIPEAKNVLHKCDNPPCVNPDHLYLGTQQQNVDDRMRRGRHNYGTHQGTTHPLAKLVDEDIREIRASTESISALARAKAVSRATIHAIRNCETWQHVKGAPSEETLAKIAARLGQKPLKPMSEEARQQMSSSRMGGKNHLARAITFEGVVYNAIADAMRQTGLTKGQMMRHLKDGHARYLDESSKETEQIPLL